MPERAVSSSNTINHQYSADILFSESFPPIDFVARPGDGHWQVAEQLKAQGFYPDIPVSDLAELISYWNGGASGFHAGRALKVAPPKDKTLVKGDCPWALAVHYKSKGYFAGLSTAELSNQIANQTKHHSWEAGAMVSLATSRPTPSYTQGMGIKSSIAANGDTIPPLDYVAQAAAGGTHAVEGPWQIAQTLKDAGFYQNQTVQQVYENIKFWNAIDDNGVKPGMRLKVSPPPAYTVPEGKGAYSAALYYLNLGYFQGTEGKNNIAKANALGLEIQKWPAAADWRSGLTLAPQDSSYTRYDPAATFTRGASTITWTATDDGGKAATSSMTAPVFAQTHSDAGPTWGDNFSKPIEAAPSGSPWVYPSVRDQRMDIVRAELGDYIGWDGFDQGAEFLSGLEVGCKVKIRTVDRMDGSDGAHMYKGRSGNWQTSGGWTWLDRALEQIPWYKRFNEKYGGAAVSVGFRPMRINAGDPRVKGDGYISAEAPRWEVEVKAGSLANSGLGELFALASGGSAAPGATILANKIGKLPVSTMNRLSVQVSDYVLYDNPLGGDFASDAAPGQEFKRGDLIRYGLKYELPFKVLGRDSSIKARFNAKGEFLGVDLQVYNKQWDENLAQAATSKIPGGRLFKRWAEHMRSTPELSAEAGINFPVRFYRDADNNLYMRFPLLSGVLRLGTEAGDLRQVMAAAAITPEFDPNIQNEPEVDFHDLSVIKLPEMASDPIAAFDRFGSYMSDPRAAAIADGVSAMAGSNPEESTAAREYMADLSTAVWTANPVAGGNPLNLVGNVKRWAAGDQFRGPNAADWLMHNGGADGVLDWLPYAYEGGHLSPYAALSAFRTARDTGSQAISRDAQRVIDVDAAMGALTTVEHTLQQHAVLGANQMLNGPDDVAAAIDRAKVKYGDGSNAYRAFLRELANPTLDFGHPDLAAMNRVYYAYVNSDLDVPASGMKTMGGRFVWDPECQTRLRQILQEDKEATPRPVPVAQAGVADWSSPEDQLAALPDVDSRNFTALEAGEIWQKQPSHAAAAIEQILDQGLSTPFELTRAMQANVPWGGSQTTYDQIVAADRMSTAIKAFDLAQRTMRFMDQWLVDFRRNIMKLPDGETERPRIKNIGTWVDLPTSLVMLRAEYRVKGQLHLYQAHLDMLADILGPSGISFHNADLQQAFARKGYTAPKNEEIARYLYGRNVKAGR